MVRRELSFIEYKERVEEAGHRGDAVIELWNYLAVYMLDFFNERYGEPAKCTLLVWELLEVKPSWFRHLKGVDPAKIAIYEALYRSLKSNPESLRNYSKDVSKDDPA